jgi:alpha,alpha-trehalase
MYPLFFGISPPVQAMKTSKLLEGEFLHPGGVVTTLRDTGQQWDFPNGWAPLHWITIKGLENYKFYDLASEIRQRWVSLNTSVYKYSGKLTERYNVVTADQATAAGEYPVQDGFGWTNGVLLSLLKKE